jgi:hypothetical protein
MDYMNGAACRAAQWPPSFWMLYETHGCSSVPVTDLKFQAMLPLAHKYLVVALVHLEDTNDKGERLLYMAVKMNMEVPPGEDAQEWRASHRWPAL